MALARCKGHGFPEGRSYEYVIAKPPIGYPSRSAVRCGRQGCVGPALIWLTGEEKTDYEKGYRVFPFHDFASVRLRKR